MIQREIQNQYNSYSCYLLVYDAAVVFSFNAHQPHSHAPAV